MKWFVTITVLAVALAGDFIDSNEAFKDGDRYFYFPGDGDGILHLVDVHEPVNYTFLEEYARDPTNNIYWLFTRSNPTVPQVLVPNKNETIINKVNLNKNIVILIHGWHGNGGNQMNKVLTEAFLKDNDVNVIVLDWNRLAHKSYVTAKKGTPAVGKALGEFIKWIVNRGASYNKIHVVGFSLGGHLAGCAGRHTEAIIKRITGLDPAGPLWKTDKDRLTSADAQYVEVIHSNTALYGIKELCGHADFFPNGGAFMPGCLLLNVCSHSRSYEYMASSVVYDHFIANQCADIHQMTKNNCTGSLYHMGNSDQSKARSGIFRVNTKKNYPF